MVVLHIVELEPEALRLVHKSKILGARRAPALCQNLKEGYCPLGYFFIFAHNHKYKEYIRICRLILPIYFERSFLLPFYIQFFPVLTP